MQFDDEVIARFYSRVVCLGSEDCWLWHGTTHSTRGYGVFFAGGRRYLAHRFSYMISVGEVRRGLCVCHRCDNPRCVNPRHLFLGTDQDNMSDMVAKGRSTRGENIHSAKLTTERAAEIKRAIVVEEWSPSAMAKRFGITRPLLYAIRSGRAWGWLEV